VNTEIGTKYKLVNVPKLANIIANKIKQEMIEMMVVCSQYLVSHQNITSEKEFHFYEFCDR
jgi:hypothetical protein